MEDFWAKHDFKHPEEMSIGGLERFKIAGEHWATWATLTDIRIDIERAVLTVYEQVKDDPAGLLALYAATTSATSKDLTRKIIRSFFSSLLYSKTSLAYIFLICADEAPFFADSLSFMRYMPLM